MIGKVLIVDDVSTNRIVFKSKLAQAGYDTVLAGDAGAGLVAARAGGVDLILLACTLPGQSAFRLVEQLRANLATRRLPIVTYGPPGDQPARMASLMAGADDVLDRRVDDQVLLARLRNLIRDRGGLAADEPEGSFAELAEAPGMYLAPGLVAVVTERPEQGMRLRDQLRAHSRDQVLLLTPDTVFDGGQRPDIYVIAADLAGAQGTGTPGTDSGLRLMSDLHSRPASRHAAICVIHRGMTPTMTATAFDLGAQDVVAADAPPAELALRLSILLHRKRDADRARANVQDGWRLAMEDPLTGLHNRRYAMGALQAMLRQSQDTGLGFAVMVLDLDRFKTVNDRFGHAAGDAVLIEVGRRLADALREGDLLARIGGEEFLVALPHAELEEAENVAARLCHVMQERPVALPGGQRTDITASIGLTVSGRADGVGAEVGIGSAISLGQIQAIIHRADVALLAAKAAGRNQVTVGRSAA